MQATIVADMNGCLGDGWTEDPERSSPTYVVLRSSRAPLSPPSRAPSPGRLAALPVRILKFAEQRLATEERLFSVDIGQIPAQRLRPLRLTARNVEGSSTCGNCDAETGLAGWAYEIRTPESVRKQIHLNWRHNFRGFGRNSAAETVRV